jgi:hypothetical protein
MLRYHSIFRKLHFFTYEISLHSVTILIVFKIKPRNHLSKVFGNVKKNPYIINQNHIFNFVYYEVISG